MADLSRLTSAEREMLRLLAEGHTAKSIAAARGLSVDAVNGRLREARRKTGAASSRELARLLRESPPENGDDFVEVSDSGPSVQIVPARPATFQGRITTMGWIAVTLAALAAALLTAQLVQNGTPPQVVATSPASDAQVAPGPATISVTFDQPMRDDSYSFVIVDPAGYPDCDKQPRQSADGRTFTLACRLAPGRHYAIGFNGGRFRNFKSRGGVSAAPSVLRFATR